MEAAVGTCPQCSSVLPADAPEGLCPVCLLRDVRTMGASPDAPDDAPEEARALPTFAGLEVLEEVAPGVGGMGVVYRAREPSLDRIVAVKTTRLALTTVEGRELFKREARAAARLDHPHILRIFRYDPDSTPPFFVMQYIDGRPLDVAVVSRGRDPEFIAAVLEKVARALAYAHGRGVAHRDIKPRNILIDADGEPRVADFGLASLPQAGGAGNDGPAISSLVGTPPFIAPEVYAGQSAAGALVDVYGLGVTMYELLTGRLPFSGRDFASVRDAVLSSDPPLPQEVNSSIPEPLQRICLKAIERDPAARYESAAAMAEDLRRYRERREVSARPTRYQAELRGKLQTHLTDIHLWQEQNLIDFREMDRLSLPYHASLAAASPVHQLARRFPWETVVLRLGGWLVLLSSVLWPAFYWDRISRWQRIVAVGFPAIAMNCVGWVLLARRSRVNALIYLSTGALLLPLAVSVLLVEYRLLAYPQSESKEWFAPLPQHQPAPTPGVDEPPEEFKPTNVQLTVSVGVFVLYCLFVLLKTRSAILTIWLSVGVYLWVWCFSLLVGLKQWVENDHVSRALLIFLALSLVFWGFTLFLRRKPLLPGGAAVSYAFFIMPFVVFMTMLAYFGSVEWFHAPYLWDNETFNRWLIVNGLVYAGLATISYRSRISDVRMWGGLVMLLIPLHFITPTNMLWNEGAPLFTLGDGKLTTYELASLLICLGLVVVGTRMRLHTLALPALIGLAVFIVRATNRHFSDDLGWPLGLAVSGGVAMVAALASLIYRVRRQRESMI